MILMSSTRVRTRMPDSDDNQIPMVTTNGIHLNQVWDARDSEEHAVYWDKVRVVKIDDMGMTGLLPDAIGASDLAIKWVAPVTLRAQYTPREGT